MRKPILEIAGIEEGWIRGRLKGGDEDGNAYCVNMFSEAMPKNLRSFNDTHTEIFVDPSVFDTLIDTGMKCCEQVYMRETPDDVTPGIVPDEGADPWSSYLKLASNEILKQIHKLMIISLHPDRRGGDEEKMKKQNIYWDKISKERGIK